MSVVLFCWKLLSGCCRDDLQVPTSPYFPTYAQGQGPSPMVQERFQSVISQLFQHVRSGFDNFHCYLGSSVEVSDCFFYLVVMIIRE